MKNDYQQAEMHLKYCEKFALTLGKRLGQFKIMSFEMFNVSVTSDV